MVAQKLEQVKNSENLRFIAHTAAHSEELERAQKRAPAPKGALDLLAEARAKDPTNDLNVLSSAGDPTRDLNILTDPLASPHAGAPASNPGDSVGGDYPFPAPGLIYYAAAAAFLIVKLGLKVSEVYSDIETTEYKVVETEWNTYAEKDKDAILQQARSEICGGVTGIASAGVTIGIMAYQLRSIHNIENVDTPTDGENPEDLGIKSLKAKLARLEGDLGSSFELDPADQTVVERLKSRRGVGETADWEQQVKDNPVDVSEARIRNEVSDQRAALEARRDFEEKYVADQVAGDNWQESLNQYYAGDTDTPLARRARGEDFAGSDGDYLAAAQGEEAVPSRLKQLTEERARYLAEVPADDDGTLAGEVNELFNEKYDSLYDAYTEHLGLGAPEDAADVVARDDAGQAALKDLKSEELEPAVKAKREMFERKIKETERNLKAKQAEQQKAISFLQSAMGISQAASFINIVGASYKFKMADAAYARDQADKMKSLNQMMVSQVESRWQDVCQTENKALQTLNGAIRDINSVMQRA